MGFFDLFKRPSFNVKNEAIPTSNNMINQGVTYLSADGSAYIKNGYKENPTVYSVINILLREYCKGKYYAVRNGERIDDHQVLDLFNNPNPNQGQSEFLEAQLGYKLITGESFIHMVWPDAGVNANKPVQLWNIPPIITDFKTDSFGTPTVYEIKVGGRTVKIPAEEMINMQYWNPDGNRGMSRLEAARKSVKQSNDAYTANMKLLQNSGAQGILSNVGEDDLMTAEQRDMLEDRYYSKYGGVDNYGRIMVTSASLSWQQIGLPATDLALIESQKLSKEDIAMTFGVPMELIISGTTYENRKNSRKELINNIVIPEHELALGEYNRQLVPRYDDIDELRLDTSCWPELEQDKATQAAWLTNVDFMTLNEKRIEMGFEELPDPAMDEVYIGSNKMPINLPLEDQAKLLNADYFGKGEN